MHNTSRSLKFIQLKEETHIKKRAETKMKEKYNAVELGTPTDAEQKSFEFGV